MKLVLAVFDCLPEDEAYFQSQLSQDFELICSADPLGAKTVGQAARATCVSVHVASSLPAEVIAAMPNLRHIACRSTGYDAVDLDYAATRHVSVSTVPSYGAETVSEYAFMLLLALTRKLMLSAHSMRYGGGSPAKLSGYDLSGKTLGIIGAGRIGRRSAAIGRGFGMEVIAYDPLPGDQAAAASIGFSYVQLNELLRRADAITLHAPATPETHHILSSSEFERMKPGVIIINTARGSLIDTPSLIAALQSGQVGSAGLDVIEDDQYHRELMALPQVLLTPHNAYNTFEALSRIRATTLENIQSWLAGRTQNIVGTG